MNDRKFKVQDAWLRSGIAGAQQSAKTLGATPHKIMCVHTVLVARADAVTARTWVSASGIADTLGTNREIVQKALEALVACGAIREVGRRQNGAREWELLEVEPGSFTTWAMQRQDARWSAETEVPSDTDWDAIARQLEETRQTAVRPW